MKDDHNILHTVMLLIVLIALGIWGYTAWVSGPSSQGLATEDEVHRPFTLVDHTGREVSDFTFSGQYQLIYFGYSRCPDACPIGLEKMAKVLKAINFTTRHIQPLFVTVDPVHDTPDVLAGYLAIFHPGILGLTGTETQIEEMTAAYGVTVRTTGEGLSIDHSDGFFLVGPKGGLIQIFPAALSVREIAQRIAFLVPRDGA
jgi:protein SCO1